MEIHTKDGIVIGLVISAHQLASQPPDVTNNAKTTRQADRVGRYNQSSVRVNASGGVTGIIDEDGKLRMAFVSKYNIIGALILKLPPCLWCLVSTHSWSGFNDRLSCYICLNKIC